MGIGRSQRHLVQREGVNSAGEGWLLPGSPGFVWPINGSGIARQQSWVLVANAKSRMVLTTLSVRGFGPPPDYKELSFDRVYSIALQDETGVQLTVAQIASDIEAQLTADPLGFVVSPRPDRPDDALLVSLPDTLLEIFSP